jgi:MFS superfamily sulfate permease-like transporter
MLDAMIELLRLPEVQRVLAILAAIASGCISFRVAVPFTMPYAIKRAPRDGQAGLGAGFMGGLTFVLVASATYFVVSYSMRAWEERYMRKLDEREGLEEMRSARS